MSDVLTMVGFILAALLAKYQSATFLNNIRDEILRLKSLGPTLSDAQKKKLTIYKRDWWLGALYGSMILAAILVIALLFLIQLFSISAAWITRIQVSVTVLVVAITLIGWVLNVIAEKEAVS